MHKHLKEMIYNREVDDSLCSDLNISSTIKIQCRKAFQEQDEQALLEVHRVLYQINLAHLSVPWEASPVNLDHTLIKNVSRTINTCWEQAERKKHLALFDEIPNATNFENWIRKFVNEHPTNIIHPVFPFIKDKASFSQIRDFFIQETPLEMMFGDIIAMMLPGVYSEIKSEIACNFWDEVGKGSMDMVHRELRGNIMEMLEIEKDCYINQIEIFEREELELINTYLSSALDRTQLAQLVGSLLATELMIPGRFVYLIEGWKRNGIKLKKLKYLTDHVTVDAEHAENWMHKVVMPLVTKNPAIIPDIILGVARRMEVAGRVCDRLYNRIKNIKTSSLSESEMEPVV